jgi:hypothetical protein
MRVWIVGVTSLVLLAPQISKADFKYTETTQFTGGAVAGLMRFASKVAGKHARPDSSTYYIKGNRMRVEDGDGEIQIIDLDVRHIISINPRTKTYGVITFAEMRSQLDEMRQLSAKSGQMGQAHVAPKVQVTPTQNSKILLGQNVREIQARVEMRVNDGGPNPGAGAMTIVSNTWVAPSVRGYEEVRNFYQRLSRELNWAPGKGLAADPRMSQAMEEMKENSPILSGFPLQNSLTMIDSFAGTKRSTEGQPDPPAADIPTTVPTSKGDAANEALGGLLSLHRPKKNGQQNPSSGESAESEGNVLLSATTEVSSFSSLPLDVALFEVPAGYRQAQKK